LRRSLDSARDLEKIANRKGIPIFEPFTGTSAWDAAVQVVGPTQQYYESLPDFRCTPEPKEAAMKRLLMTLREAVSMVAEDWNIETPNDKGDTSAENNSSAIVLIRPEVGHSLLFTADAGIPALTLTADILEYHAFDYNSIKMIQVLHHGSRRNVGATILNRLLGDEANRHRDSPRVVGLPGLPRIRAVPRWRRGAADGDCYRRRPDPAVRVAVLDHPEVGLARFPPKPTPTDSSPPSTSSRAGQ
jgi:hypothetical protein